MERLRLVIVILCSFSGCAFERGQLAYSCGDHVPYLVAAALGAVDDRKATEQGDALAPNNPGWMYEGGQGVPRDLAEAQRWHERAAVTFPPGPERDHAAQASQHMVQMLAQKSSPAPLSTPAVPAPRPSLSPSPTPLSPKVSQKAKPQDLSAPSSPPAPTAKEKLYRLTVQANPADSRITLLNSSDKYDPGIPLRPGSYQVQVEKEGYETKQQVVILADADLVVETTLQPGPTVIGAPSTAAAQGDKKPLVVEEEKHVQAKSQENSNTTLPIGQISQIVLPFLYGGLAGALVNVYFMRRRQRIEVAFKLIDGFFSRYDLLAEVKDLLQNPTALQNSPNKMNRVREMGDWFDMVALFCKKKSADKQLIQEVGINHQIQLFRSGVQTAGNAGAPALNDLLLIWASMREFS